MAKSRFFVLVAGVLIALSMLGCERRSSKIPPCHELLVLADLAKKDWANDYSKTSNAIPTWDDLRFYFPDWATNKLVGETQASASCGLATPTRGTAEAGASAVGPARPIRRRRLRRRSNRANKRYITGVV